MKVTSFDYRHPEHCCPVGEISSWFGLKKRKFICLGVSRLFARWVSLETGKELGPFSDEYVMLNEAGTLAQLKYKTAIQATAANQGDAAIRAAQEGGAA